MTEQEINNASLSEETPESVEARKKLLIFWARMIGWLATGVGVPITTFAIKFGLFDTYGYTVTTDELGNITDSHVAINGWGIISCILIGVAALNIISEIIDAYSNTYSLTKQCLMGLKNRIIPLAIAIGVCYYLKWVMEQVIFCLIIIGTSQIAAIPLNPMPQWKYEKKGREDYSDLLTGLRTLLKDYSNKRKKGDN